MIVSFLPTEVNEVELFEHIIEAHNGLIQAQQKLNKKRWNIFADINAEIDEQRQWLNTCLCSWIRFDWKNIEHDEYSMSVIKAEPVFGSKSHVIVYEFVLMQNGAYLCSYRIKR